MGDYIGGRFTKAGALLGFTGQLEDGRLVLRSPDDRVLAEGWDGLLGLLEALPAGIWHDFHIWREWPAAEAIGIGQPFALRELVPVLIDLARVYLDVVAGLHPRST